MSLEQRPFHVGPEDGEALWLLGGLYSYKTTADQVGSDYTAIEVQAGAGMAIPVHHHDREAEGFYVAAGTLTMLVGGEELTAPTGSFVFAPPNVDHAFRFETDGRLLLLLTRGTGHEGLFRAIGEPAGARTVPDLPDLLPDPEEMARTAAAHGTIIVGPPFVDPRLADAAANA